MVQIRVIDAFYQWDFNSLNVFVWDDYGAGVIKRKTLERGQKDQFSWTGV